jgi:hypothetical protein
LDWSSLLAELTIQDDELHARLVALLDQLAGAGEGQALLEQLLDRAEPPEHIAGRIAASAAFEQLYKVSRTGFIGVEGSKEAEPAFVGLPDLPKGLSFEEQFRERFRPRLAERADGFEVIFGSLPKPPANLLIVETGCLRIPRNWGGDGQSTFMFDALARDRGGLFFSIDATPESVDTARRACSSATQLILNDSVAALHALSRGVSIQASLLYLDSFDVDPADPLPSAIHHALELTAARPLLGPGSIVCVDDYAIGDGGGKAMIVDRFFANIRAEVLYSGYQKVWRVP